MALALALLGWGCGVLIVNPGCPRQGSLFSDILLGASLSFGVGVGVFSVIFFILKVIGSSAVILADLLVFALLLISFLWLRSRRPSTKVGLSLQKARENSAWVDYLLNFALAVALAAAGYFGIVHTVAHPNGDGWDAFAIWNLRARFLFLGGWHWRDGFTPLLTWSHPDYPLLLPGVVAHFWSLLGHDNRAVPAVIGLLFTFSTVAVLYSSLSILGGARAGKLGAMVLLATPSFIEQGTSQYADIPLSFFMLATIALLSLHDRHREDAVARSASLLALAGFGAGFAAWTKNEGLLFFCALILACMFIGVRRASSGGRRFAFAALLMAASPLLLVILYFKLLVATAGDLFSNPTIMLDRLLDPNRYWIVIRWFGKGFLRFGHWLGIPASLLMLGAYFFARQKKRTHFPDGFRISRLALSLTFAGYFVIYLITPYDLYWHLRFSQARLFLQLWPSVICLFFLAIGEGNDDVEQTRT
jgi:hypothetical protein